MGSIPVGSTLSDMSRPGRSAASSPARAASPSLERSRSTRPTAVDQAAVHLLGDRSGATRPTDRPGTARCSSASVRSRPHRPRNHGTRQPGRSSRSRRRRSHFAATIPFMEQYLLPSAKRDQYERWRDRPRRARPRAPDPVRQGTEPVLRTGMRQAGPWSRTVPEPLLPCDRLLRRSPSFLGGFVAAEGCFTDERPATLPLQRRARCDRRATMCELFARRPRRRTRRPLAAPQGALRRRGAVLGRSRCGSSSRWSCRSWTRTCRRRTSGRSTSSGGLDCSTTGSTQRGGGPRARRRLRRAGEGLRALSAAPLAGTPAVGQVVGGSRRPRGGRRGGRAGVRRSVVTGSSQPPARRKYSATISPCSASSVASQPRIALVGKHRFENVHTNGPPGRSDPGAPRRTPRPAG